MWLFSLLQIATAVYFVIIDTAMMLQFLYYVVRNQGTKGMAMVVFKYSVEWNVCGEFPHCADHCATTRALMVEFGALLPMMSPYTNQPLSSFSRLAQVLGCF